MNRYYKIGLLHKVKAHIKRGEVIAYPTESCYGLGCNPYDYKAINKIFKLKKRSKAKGFIVVAGGFKQLAGVIKPLTANELSIAKRYWPGLYSLILKTKPNVPPNLTGKFKTVAIRVSAQKNIQQLCNWLNSSLVSTSANRAKQLSIKTYRECVKRFGKSTLVLPGLIGFAKKPSTIIDIATNKIIRK